MIAVKAPVDTIELSQPDASPRRGRRTPQSFLLPDFISGPENAFALFVCRQPEPISQRGNPLLLVGPSGSGKTALAMTIVQRELSNIANSPLPLDASSLNPAATETQGAPEATGESPSLLYLPAVDFARNYGQALGADDLEHFRRRLAMVDRLVVDDIHAIADKTAAQEELAARIESRVLNAQTTILTCRRLPSELRGIRPLLASRMLPGLTVSLALPGAAARHEILTRLCRQADLAIDSDWVDLLARGLPNDLSARQLAAVVQHLRLLHQRGHTIDSKAIEAAIGTAIGGTEPTIAAIAKAVARRFQLKTSELKSSTRRQQVVRARSLAMYLGRQLTESSLQQIGEYFGGRDHSTVLHACRTTEKMLATNSQLSQTADEVSEQLRVAG